MLTTNSEFMLDAEFMLIKLFGQTSKNQNSHNFFFRGLFKRGALKIYINILGFVILLPNSATLLTVQLWQHAPDRHWAQYFNRQVLGSQHGSVWAHSWKINDKNVSNSCTKIILSVSTFIPYLHTALLKWCKPERACQLLF